MRDVVGRGAAVRFARATRRDLLLETLALRHQLGVLARSNRRVRPADRLLWLFLRWWWPRWREALVLVQPATVDRWHREGLRRCWRRRSRRPGRPRIESACRDLIRRMPRDNCLWGAPRIHGELLKLGIAVSERTVSRYLRGRPTTRSQTWRTVFANHFGERMSPVIFADDCMDDIVSNASNFSSCAAPWSLDGPCASIHGAVVDWRRSLPHPARGMPPRQDQLQDRRRAGTSTGRDPPQAATVARSRGISFVRAESASTNRQWEIIRRASHLGILSLPSRAMESSTSAEGNIRSARNGVRLRRYSPAIGVLAKHR